jgi:hypothetical protein
MSYASCKGQNIPIVHTYEDGSGVKILPVLMFLLEYDEDTIGDLLPYKNPWEWAQNYYKVVYLEPDFDRYGCIPSWFPTTDQEGRPLTPQGQVDRFLYLLDLAYGGFIGDHRSAPHKEVAEAMWELCFNMGEYLGIEADDDMEWELEQKNGTARDGN